MADVNPAFDGEFSALFQPNCCDEETKHQWSETRESSPAASPKDFSALILRDQMRNSPEAHFNEIMLRVHRQKFLNKSGGHGFTC